MRIEGSFEVSGWQEETYEEMGAGARLARASVTQRFEGGITGGGAVQWLMAYRPDGTARFVGLQRVEGRIGERRGTFLLETAGDFDGTMARWQASVVPSSGTDGLVGLTGQGTFGAPHGPEATFELDLDFA
ncbi:MAG TPA: DUF3224 domain-containing protein [Acidimicrobiales bacterium]